MPTHLPNNAGAAPPDNFNHSINRTETPKRSEYNQNRNESCSLHTKRNQKPYPNIQLRAPPFRGARMSMGSTVATTRIDAS